MTLPSRKFLLVTVAVVLLVASSLLTQFPSQSPILVPLEQTIASNNFTSASNPARNEQLKSSVAAVVLMLNSTNSSISSVVSQQHQKEEIQEELLQAVSRKHDSNSRRTSDTAIPEWLEAYEQFHHDSIQGSKVKDGVPFLVYQCHGDCAGLGGRLKAMIKSFYAAVCSQRVFLIDAIAPVPLQDYLAPHLIQWNATWNNNSDVQVVRAFHRQGSKYNLTIPSINQQLGVIIEKAHGKTIPDLKQILSFCSHPTTTEHAKEQQLYHWGANVLFQFSSPVVTRAEKLKQDANLSSTAPYVGLHLRTGKGDTWNEQALRLRRNGLVKSAFVQCFQTFHEYHGYHQAYVAADHNGSKVELHQQDSRLHFTNTITTFHIDLSPNASAASMLDLFAEFKVLVDATCIVMSHSSFSFAAHFMAPHQPHCGMLARDCTNETVQRRPAVNYKLKMGKFIVDN